MESSICGADVRQECFDILMHEFKDGMVHDGSKQAVEPDEFILHRHPERFGMQCCIGVTRRSCKETCEAEALPQISTPAFVSKAADEAIAKIV